MDGFATSLSTTRSVLIWGSVGEYFANGSPISVACSNELGIGMKN